MAERRPPGFTVDLGFYDSPEVLSIPRNIRAEAVGVWTLAGAYSANQLTDGHVSAEILKSLGCRKPIRAALMATRNADGSPSPLWIEGENGGILFTRWSKWQRTSDEVRSYRLSESDRKKRARAAVKQAAASGDAETSAKRPPGQLPDVRVERREPKTETKTETVITTHLPTQQNVSRRARENGAELARARFANLPVRSIDAYRIAEAFSASLPTPIERNLLAGVGKQIDSCLQSNIPPPAIAEGLKAWTASDSWSPTQIPNFVHKANNQAARANGKPTAKAVGYDEALTELLQEVQT